MPHRFRYNWIGDDGATRSRTLVLHDDGRAEMEPETVRRPKGGTTSRATTGRAAQYAAAESSLFREGPVSDEVFAARTGPDGCGSCVHLIASPHDAIGLCGKCRCGDAARARLTIKARMPKARCPLKPPRWAEAEGTGAGMTGRARQVVGVVAGIVDMLVGGKRRRERQQRIQKLDRSAHPAPGVARSEGLNQGGNHG